jgi:hypothetical protein
VGTSRCSRQSFHEWAGRSIAQSQWARAYYEQQRQRGKGHHAAVRALAFKWIRVAFRCWKNRVAYDESMYMATLARRASLQSGSTVALSPVENAVKFLWRFRGKFVHPDQQIVDRATQMSACHARGRGSREVLVGPREPLTQAPREAVNLRNLLCSSRIVGNPCHCPSRGG